MEKTKQNLIKILNAHLVLGQDTCQVHRETLDAEGVIAQREWIRDWTDG